MTAQIEPNVSITRLSPPADFRALIAADVRAGLGHLPKTLPSKYFYDGLGSELFEAITELPEYYLTRIETEILRAESDRLLTTIRPDTIVEIGSGSSEKTRILIRSMMMASSGSTYMPIDISEDAVSGAAETLRAEFPTLNIAGMIGDFMKDLHLVPKQGRRIISFLGSTFGNFPEADRVSFLSEVRSMMGSRDRFLLGIDLVKSPHIVLPAYNDESGVTAAFNQNILRVVNRNLDANFEPGAFEHVARWNEAARCIDAFLVATRPMTVHIAGLGLDVEVGSGEEIHTEISCKFDRSSIERAFSGSNLLMEEWLTDVDGWYAVAVAAPV